MEYFRFFYHSSFCGGHCAPKITAYKVLQCDLFWPNLFSDAFRYCSCLML